MPSLATLQRLLAEGRFDFSHHAFQRAVQRDISDGEIRFAGASAEVIEDYPHDKHGPSSLLLGFTEANRPLHMQAALIESDWVRIITLYEPESERWINNRIRRR